MIIVQAKVGSVNITTTAKVTPSSSVPEIETDNNVHKVGSPARVTRIPSIAWRTEKKSLRRILARIWKVSLWMTVKNGIKKRRDYAEMETLDILHLFDPHYL